METIKCEDKPLEGMPDGIQPLRLGPVPTASQPPAAATRK
jgi:hypothetical protein